MNPNFIFLSCLLCWTAFMVQQGESVLYYTPLLAAAGTSVTVATPVLLAGCLLLKAGAVAIFALSSVRYLFYVLVNMLSFISIIYVHQFVEQFLFCL